MPPAWKNSGFESWDRIATSGSRAERRSPTSAAPWHWNTATRRVYGPFDRLLEDDVGLVEPGRRAVAGVVADLDGQGRAGRDDASRGRCAGQRAGATAAAGRAVVEVVVTAGAAAGSPRVTTSPITMPMRATVTPPST